jgi:simple sugar transport system permease protein
MSNPIGQSPEPMPPKRLVSLPIERLFHHDAHLVRLFVIMVIVFIAMVGVSPDTFLSLDSLSSMAFQFPEYGILSLAMMLTMISGGIDLSIVGIANLSAIVASMIMVTLIPEEASVGYSLLVISAAVIVCLLNGLLCGLLNGYAIAKIGIPAILVTLGTMQLFTGLAIVITKGKAIVGLPELFSYLGNGSILSIPFPLLIFGLCMLLTYVLLHKQPFGLKLYMLGANPTAARFSGINNTAILLKTYAVSGLFAAIAGLVIVAHTNSAKADYGTSYILQSILVAIMGGVDPKGGFGKISGIIMAVLTLQFLSSGLNTLHVSNFFKDFVWGIVLLIVMVVNEICNRISLKKHRLHK